MEYLQEFIQNTETPSWWVRGGALARVFFQSITGDANIYVVLRTTTAQALSLPDLDRSPSPANI